MNERQIMQSAPASEVGTPVDQCCSDCRCHEHDPAKNTMQDSSSVQVSPSLENDTNHEAKNFLEKWRDKTKVGRLDDGIQGSAIHRWLRLQSRRYKDNFCNHVIIQGDLLDAYDLDAIMAIEAFYALQPTVSMNTKLKLSSAVLRQIGIDIRNERDYKPRFAFYEE